jgi:hypothetical protein
MHIHSYTCHWSFGYVGTGIVYAGNKGGVGLSLILEAESSDEKNISMVFVNSHFAAHTPQIVQRRKDFVEISRRMVFDMYSSDELTVPSIWDHDVIFWFGDLNYRIVETCKNLIQVIKNHREESYKALIEYDQLHNEMNSSNVFEGFTEPEINFMPTFKYDVGTIDTFDTSKKARAPAWTDRILYSYGRVFKQREDSDGWMVDCSFYKSHQSVVLSDHKPVSGLFKVSYGYVGNETAISTKYRLTTLDPFWFVKKIIGYFAGIVARGLANKSRIILPLIVLLLAIWIVRYYV